VLGAKFLLLLIAPVLASLCLFSVLTIVMFGMQVWSVLNRLCWGTIPQGDSEA